jgi:hypothetical protein
VLGTILSTTAGSHIPAPLPFTINSLYITADAAISGSTVTFTVQVGDVDIAVTCVLASGGTAISVTGLSVAVAAGAKVSIKAVESGTTAQTAWHCRATLGVTY